MIYNLQGKNSFQIMQDLRMEQTSISTTFNALKSMVLGSNNDKNLQSLCDFISLRLGYISDTMEYLDNQYKERYYKKNEQYKDYQRKDSRVAE